MKVRSARRRAAHRRSTTQRSGVLGPNQLLALAGMLAFVTVGVVGVAVVINRTAPVSDGAGKVTRTEAAPASASSRETAVPEALRATGLRIPALSISTELVPLELALDGVLPPPPEPDVAGWFADGPVPGELGRVVIAGHVNSRAGPGVFAHLADLAVGSEVEVDRSDGQVVSYQVVSVDFVDKKAFPTADVYGPAPVPELRLVTCGGGFDRSTGRYLNNVIVGAVQR